MDHVTDSSDQPDTPCTINLGWLLECLALAIAAETDLSAFAARAEAQHVYAQAYHDYLSTGGGTHAGFIRWLDKQVGQPATITAHSPKTITT